MSDEYVIRLGTKDDGSFLRQVDDDAYEFVVGPNLPLPSFAGTCVLGEAETPALDPYRSDSAGQWRNDGSWRMRVADEAGALRAERDDLLRENAVLRRKLEQLERRAKR